MKTIRLIALLLLLPLTFHAQSLNGLWTGTLTNDSNTIRRDQSFEIVLTQYKEKVFGYSRMTFFVNDTLYYIVKRVKGTVDGDVCEVKDDEILKHNFPVKPEKGVRLITTFRRNKQDSTWYLDGNWRTTETRKHGYYAISGKLSLKEEPDLEKSKIIPHLEELKLADDVAVYREARAKREAEAAAMASAAKKQPASSKPAGPQRPPARVQPPENPATAVPGATDEKNGNTQLPSERTEVAATTSPAIAAPAGSKAVPPKQAIPQAATTQTGDQGGVTKRSPGKSQPTSTNPKAETKPVMTQTDKAASVPPTATNNAEQAATNQKTVPVNSAAPPPPIASKPAVSATYIEPRKIAGQQVVYFKSDSLELALYDNGEIDGDTVSILINGELIMAHQGLKASAIRKTIYVPSGTTDSLTLVLYAENLGKYPPSTGLLVVHDGDDVYQVRFSADLQQNAAVVFRRRR